MEKFEIFLDMDEVIFDLSGIVVDIMNEENGTNLRKEDNNSYWWQDFVEVEKSYFEELLLRKNTFLLGEAIEGSIESINKLKDLGFNIHIITTPQYNNRHCFSEKVAWIKHYLPFMNFETNFHTTGSKGLLAGKNRLLIDDNISNLKAWKKSGGTAIAFGGYGWNKEWLGLKAKNWKDLFILIRTLEEMKGVNKEHE